MCKIFIYGLFDPRKPDLICYVGKTKRSLRARLKSHIISSKLTKRPSAVWITELLTKEIQPCIHLLEECEQKNWRTRERRAITLFRNRNHSLLNTAKGGGGPDEGKRKVYCDRCGLKRRRTPSGTAWCNCFAKLKRTIKRQKKYSRTKEGNSKLRKAHRRYWQTAKGKAVHRRHRLTAKGQAYIRDYYQAMKRGLTVAQYRAQVQT